MAADAHDKEAEQQSDLIKSLNSLSFEAFKSRFIDSLLRDIDLGRDLSLTFYAAPAMPDSVLESCRDLVALTSSAAYKKSSVGWSPSDKLVEMKLPDMKYLLLTPRESPAEVVGFLSFMLCCEDDLDVIYCYEVHLLPAVRGRQLGYQLMGMMEHLGRQAQVEKAMLTVFTANTPALQFYNRLGYKWYDQEPPPPRKKLRGRMTATPQPSYIILAMDLR